MYFLERNPINDMQVIYSWLEGAFGLKVTTAFSPLKYCSETSVSPSIGRLFTPFQKIRLTMNGRNALGQSLFVTWASCWSFTAGTDALFVTGQRDSAFNRERRKEKPRPSNCLFSKLFILKRAGHTTERSLRLCCRPRARFREGVWRQVTSTSVRYATFGAEYDRYKTVSLTGKEQRLKFSCCSSTTFSWSFKLTEQNFDAQLLKSLNGDVLLICIGEKAFIWPPNFSSRCVIYVLQTYCFDN